MQSSYSLIKKDFAKEGTSKVISTTYVSSRVLPVNIEEEKVEEKLNRIDPEELLKKYEDIGQRIIQDAKNEKQAIVLRAQMDADVSERNAYEKGYEQGLQNGYEDGYKKAYDETIDKAKEEAAETVAKADELLKSAYENYSIYLDTKKEDVIKLAINIAESILKVELKRPDSINSIVEEAFKVSKGEDNIILKANSIHTKELKSQIDRWKISYDIKNEIFVVNDEFMESGNVILEKPSGIVKIGIETGMEQIREALLG